MRRQALDPAEEVDANKRRLEGMQTYLHPIHVERSTLRGHLEKGACSDMP